MLCGDADDLGIDCKVERGKGAKGWVLVEGGRSFQSWLWLGISGGG